MRVDTHDVMHVEVKITCRSQFFPATMWGLGAQSEIVRLDSWHPYSLSRLIGKCTQSIFMITWITSSLFYSKTHHCYHIYEGLN